MHLDAIQIVPFHHEGKFLEPRGEDVCEELPLVMNAGSVVGLNGSKTMVGLRRGIFGAALRQDRSSERLEFMWSGAEPVEALDMSRCIPLRR